MDRLTVCDMMCSIIILEISEEAKENGFKETEEEVSLVSPVMFTSMVEFVGGLEEEKEEERVLEISRADRLHECRRREISRVNFFFLLIF